MSEFEPPDEQQRDAVKKARGEEGRGAPQTQTGGLPPTWAQGDATRLASLESENVVRRQEADDLRSENASLKLEVQSLIELREAHYKQILDLRSKVAEWEAKVAELTRDHVALDALKARHQEGIGYLDKAVAHWKEQAECARALCEAYSLVVADLARSGK